MILDLKIIKTIRDVIELQTDFKNLQNWCKRNDLFLNVEKYKILRFNLINNSNF